MTGGGGCSLQADLRPKTVGLIQSKARPACALFCI